MSDFIKPKDTLPLIRKMLNPKLSKNSKSKDSKLVTVNWSSRRLKEMLWTNSGKSTATITIQLSITLRRATRRRSRNKKRIKLKTKKLRLSISVANDTKISTSWRVYSKTFSAETRTMFRLRKANKNWLENCCHTTIKERRKWTT
jgi:hypothetical protein